MTGAVAAAQRYHASLWTPPGQSIADAAQRMLDHSDFHRVNNLDNVRAHAWRPYGARPSDFRPNQAFKGR